MPDVAGQTERGGRRRSSSALGSRSTSSDRRAPTRTPGTVVLSQDPVGGDAGRRRASTVTLDGRAASPTRSTVPNVDRQADAGRGGRDALGRGLRGRHDDRRRSTTPAQDGIVVSPGPPPSGKLKTGKTVTITVGRVDARGRRRPRRRRRPTRTRREGRRPRRRPLVRARRLADAAAGRRRRRWPTPATTSATSRSARRHLGARRRGARAARRAAGCSAPMSPSRCCTGRSARTARCRACSSSSTCAYVGAGVLASAVCMDKLVFKDLMAHGGRPAGRVRGADAADATARRRRSAARAGSSRRGWARRSGSSGSSGAEELADAVALRRFAHDPRVIVEATRPALEVECSVLGPHRGAEASGPGEIVAPGGRLVRLRGEVHRRRHGAGGAGAHLGDRAASACASSPREAFTLAGCSGLARVDFFVDGETVLLNELNTMPGHDRRRASTASSGRPSGLAYPRLLERLLPIAHRAPRARAQLPLLERAGSTSAEELDLGDLDTRRRPVGQRRDPDQVVAVALAAGVELDAVLPEAASMSPTRTQPSIGQRRRAGAVGGVDLARQPGVGVRSRSARRDAGLGVDVDADARPCCSWPPW